MPEIIWSDQDDHELIWVDQIGARIFWGTPGNDLPYDPQPFPYSNPTTLLQQLLAYLYVQYNDDDDVAAFFDAYNTIAQQYLDLFNGLNLPDYTTDPVSGSLLDWVAEGLYGLSRPTLPTDLTTVVGPFNTYTFNQLPIDGYKPPGAASYFLTDDDTFRRIITWYFYKADGQVFSIRWLKRRVARFLFGDNGTDPPVSQTYQISVLLSGDQVNIRVLKNIRGSPRGSVFNTATFGSFDFNDSVTTNIIFPSIPEAPILKAAIDAGVLPLPFQFTYVVEV